MSVYYYWFFVLTHTHLESLYFFVKLNWDTWSNEAVSQIIMSNFFFWQVCNFLIDLSVLIWDSLLIFHKLLQDVPFDVVSNLILFGYFFPRSLVTCLFFFSKLKKKKVFPISPVQVCWKLPFLGEGQFLDSLNCVSVCVCVWLERSYRKMNSTPVI